MAGNFNVRGLQIPNDIGQNWANMVDFSDEMTDLNFATQAGLGALDSPIGSMNNPMMGNSMGNPMMGGSIFPYMGMGGNMRGMGMGSEVMNMTQEQYLKYQEKMENNQIAKQVRQQHNMEAAQFDASAAKDVIARRIGSLQRQINKNEQDHVIVEYNKLIEAVRAKFREVNYTNVPEEKVKAYAENLYFQATGESIIENIKEKADGNFVHGVKKVLGLGISNRVSADENIAQITGEEESKSGKAWKTVGMLSASVIAVATAPLILVGIAKGGKGICSGYANFVKSLFKGSEKAVV